MSPEETSSECEGSSERLPSSLEPNFADPEVGELGNSRENGISLAAIYHNSCLFWTGNSIHVPRHKIVK